MGRARGKRDINACTKETERVNGGRGGIVGMDSISKTMVFWSVSVSSPCAGKIMPEGALYTFEMERANERMRREVCCFLMRTEMLRTYYYSY